MIQDTKNKLFVLAAIALAATTITSLWYASTVVADDGNSAPQRTAAADGVDPASCPIWKCGFNTDNPGVAEIELEREISWPVARIAQSAAVRMFVADYCGNGSSWTKPGIAFAWSWAWSSESATSTPWGPAGAPGWTLEAVWDERGALCLDTPRLADRRLVEMACPVPRCSSMRLMPETAVLVSWAQIASAG